MAKSLGNYILKDVKTKYTASAFPCQGKSPSSMIITKKYQIVAFYNTNGPYYDGILVEAIYSTTF